MIKSVIEYLESVALRHKAVRTFKYEKKSHQNAQNNYGTFQVYIEENPYAELLTSQNNLFVATFNIDILAQPHTDNVINVQDSAMTIAVDFIKYIESDTLYQGKVYVRDYSFLALSEYTTDKSAGIRLTLQLVLPNPLNLCLWQDDFYEIPPNAETEDDTVEIQPDENIDNGNQLILQPITL